MSGVSWRRHHLPLAGLAVAVIVLPCASFYVALAVVVLAGSIARPDKRVVGLLCLGSVFVLGPLLALKLPVPIDGNDKAQYLGFMHEMRSYGIGPYMERQPEWLSFASLFAAAQLVGANDQAFLLLFVVYFSLLLAAIWRQHYPALPLFLMLLLSASSFFGTYGNLLRQAMAFPFLFMAIGTRGCGRATGLVALAGLAHLPALIVGVPFLLHRLVGKWMLPACLLVAAMPTRLMSMFALATGGGDSYLANKLDLYVSWDQASIAGVVSFASAILLLCALLWWRGHGWRAACDCATRELIRRYLSAIALAACALIATRDFSKVFERIYIYFFMIAMMYLALVVARLAPGGRKALTLACMVAYTFYGLGKNLAVQPLLFRGDPYGFVNASVGDLYRDFLLESK